MYGTDCAGLSPPKMVIVYEMVPAGHNPIVQYQQLVTHDCSVPAVGHT